MVNLSADDVIAWMHERMIANVCLAERHRLRRDLTDAERDTIRRSVPPPTLDDVIDLLEQIRRGSVSTSSRLRVIV